jgi:hypothetical protein
MIDIKIIDLPDGTKEGDCLKRIKGKWIIDEEEKNRRRRRIQKLLNQIENKNKK